MIPNGSVKYLALAVNIIFLKVPVTWPLNSLCIVCLSLSVHQENRRLIGHVMVVTHIHLWCQGQSGVSERRQSQVSLQPLCQQKNTRCLLERRWRGLDAERAVSRKTRAGGQADRRRAGEIQRVNASLELTHRRGFVRTEIHWPVMSFMFWMWPHKQSN